MSEPIKDAPMMDPLDEKLTTHFPGRVVRKDLVRQTKTGFNVPVYVLEYLLGKYCSSTDPEIINQGLEYVRDTLSQNYVRADESEKIKSMTRESGTHRIIDKVKVRLVETEDKYWAELTNMGVKYVNVSEAAVRQCDKLLTGGIWAIIDLRYDATFQHRGQTRPFIIEKLKPIQQPSTDFSDLYASRAHFTRDEWLDALIRSIGMEPTHPDLTHRTKLLTLMRLVPMVEANFNLIELGPRGTGKSYVYRELSPYAILISAVRRRWLSSSSTWEPGASAWWACGTWWRSTRWPAFASRIPTASRSSRTTWSQAASPAARRRCRPTPPSSTTAISTPTSTASSRPRTCSSPSRPSCRTWPSSTGSTSTSRAGTWARCSQST
jgi:hypothetical protein